jgi:hypothetical protein
VARLSRVKFILIFFRSGSDPNIQEELAKVEKELSEYEVIDIDSETEPLQEDDVSDDYVYEQESDDLTSPDEDQPSMGMRDWGAERRLRVEWAQARAGHDTAQADDEDSDGEVSDEEEPDDEEPDDKEPDDEESYEVDDKESREHVAPLQISEDSETRSEI